MSGSEEADIELSESDHLGFALDTDVAAALSAPIDAVASDYTLDRAPASADELANGGRRLWEPEASPSAELEHADDATLAYERVRRDLQVLAAHGIVLSMPVAPDAVRERMLTQVAEKRYVFVDYDDTLDPFNSVVSAETAAALADVQSSGKQVVIVTERSAVRRGSPRTRTILESMEGMASAARKGIIVASGDGRIYQYDEAGEPRLIDQEPELSAEQKDKIRSVVAEVKGGLGELGTGPADGDSEIFNPFGYSMILRAGTAPVVLIEVAARLQAQLALRGLDFEVQPRLAKDPSNPPYVTFSKLNKSIIVSRIAQRWAVQPHEALVAGDSMYVPRWTRLEPVPAEVAEAAARLGVELLHPPALRTGNEADRKMEQALPGALTVCVGALMDPRMEKGFLIPGGPAITRLLLRAVAGALPSGVVN